MPVQTIKQMARRLTSVETWLYGLLSGFIGGGATAALSAGSLAVAHSSGVDVPVLNLKAIGVVFVSAGVMTAMSYLSKSPLPPVTPVADEFSDDKETKTK